MKHRRLPRACISLVVVLIAGGVGCGETTSSPRAAGGEEPGAGGAAAGAEAMYAGVVLALASESASNPGYIARAIFKPGSRPTIGGCSKCCCAPTERGLPLPLKPPDAGEITLTGADVLATLVPDPFENGQGSLHGTTDLGWAWFPPLSNYASTNSKPWPSGSVLAVQATGNEVGEFAGMLRVGAPLAGVTPPFDDAKLVAQHAEPFTVSWTPDAGSDSTVMLRFPNDRGVCYCDAPDATGTLQVDGELLTPITGGISLTRFAISTVSSANASIDLVGAVVQKANFEVQ